MKIYLLRHGRRGPGSEHDILMPEGHEQAIKAAAFFKKIKIDKIICSTYQRAKDTAQPIIANHDCSVVYTSLICEPSLGEMFGKSQSEWNQAVKASGLSLLEYRPHGGENRYDAYERAKKFVSQLLQEKHETILIISHGGIISDIIALLKKESIEAHLKYKTSFGSISYLQLDKNFNVEESYVGDITHLI